MKKYFLQKQSSMAVGLISREQIEAYRAALLQAMEKMGATDSEKALVHDATIRNSIRRNRKPEDVAWAILQ